MSNTNESSTEASTQLPPHNDKMKNTPRLCATPKGLPEASNQPHQAVAVRPPTERSSEVSRDRNRESTSSRPLEMWEGPSNKSRGFPSPKSMRPIDERTINNNPTQNYFFLHISTSHNQFNRPGSLCGVHVEQPKRRLVSSKQGTLIKDEIEVNARRCGVDEQRVAERRDSKSW